MNHKNLSLIVGRIKKVFQIYYSIVEVFKNKVNMNCNIKRKLISVFLESVVTKNEINCIFDMETQLENNKSTLDPIKYICFAYCDFKKLIKCNII